jgi:hypothetical protein
MAKPLVINVKESIDELKTLQKTHKGDVLISKRLKMLIVIKKHESKGGISKRNLSTITSINHNSIVRWRQMYLASGISVLLEHGHTGGFKPSIVSAEAHDAMESKLKDPKNGLRGYKELLEWVHSELITDMKYITLVKYVERNFGTKIKVARKSHVKKDERSVEDFKKTSVRNAKN